MIISCLCYPCTHVVKYPERLEGSQGDKQMRTSSATKTRHSGLGEATMKLPDVNMSQLVDMVDLAGLVYDNVPHPTIFVGVPKPYVAKFKNQFMKRGVEPASSKKTGGNRHYIRISRVLDVYKVCLALRGKTLVHEKAVTKIISKLEQKYGRDTLRAALADS